MPDDWEVEEKFDLDDWIPWGDYPEPDNVADDQKDDTNKPESNPGKFNML